jgi:hypothetical protein
LPTIDPTRQFLVARVRVRSYQYRVSSLATLSTILPPQYLSA